MTYQNQFRWQPFWKKKHAIVTDQPEAIATKLLLREPIRIVKKQYSY